VRYLSRIALPPDAEVRVTLEDVSRADAPATVIAEQTIPTRGRQVPIPFELQYDPAKIDPSHRYAVRAQIRAGDELKFTSTTANPVLTQDAPSSVDLTLQPVRAGEGAGAGGAGGAGATTREAQAELIETYWKFVSIDGEPVTVAQNAREPHLILKAKDKALAGSTGVNRIVGTYELPGGAAIRLRPVGTTMMAGPEQMMKLERRLLDRLPQVDGYRLEGQRLTLNAQGRDVMELRAVYLK
jgi:putative lipoprotein